MSNAECTTQEKADLTIQCRKIHIMYTLRTCTIQRIDTRNEIKLSNLPLQNRSSDSAHAHMTQHSQTLFASTSFNSPVHSSPSPFLNPL